MEREMVTRVEVVTQSADDPRLRRAYEMRVPADFSVEAMVRAEGVQAASATIVGNHPGTNGHAGFALQQVQGRTNHFAFVFGDGKSWTQVGDAGLEAGRPHYLAMSKGGRGVRVWLDGRAIAQRELEGEMAASEFPVRLGDWLYGGRTFAGKIEQVRVQPGVLSDAEVAGRMADFKIH
jgi:hypothetical protein